MSRFIRDTFFFKDIEFRIQEKNTRYLLARKKSEIESHNLFQDKKNVRFNILDRSKKLEKQNDTTFNFLEARFAQRISRMLKVSCPCEPAL